MNRWFPLADGAFLNANLVVQVYSAPVSAEVDAPWRVYLSDIDDREHQALGGPWPTKTEADEAIMEALSDWEEGVFQFCLPTPSADGAPSIVTVPLGEPALSIRAKDIVRNGG